MSFEKKKIVTTICSSLQYGLIPLSILFPFIAQAELSDNEAHPPIQAKEWPQKKATAMETIVVTGTVLKIETPMSETPRAVSVVDQADLELHQVQKLDEALRYRSGVLSAPYGADNDTDWFKVRGFESAFYLDGSRLFSSGYYGWMIEPYGLQSVEVLKGPSSLLYGEAPPGGVINSVSKRPTATSQHSIDLQLGNRNHRQVAIDTSDSINQDARYRLVALFNERDGVLDGSDSQRYYLAPSLTWDISDATTLTLLASIQYDEGLFTGGFFPAYGTLYTEGGKIDPSSNFSDLDNDRNRKTQISVGYELAHQINNSWEFQQNFRYSYQDLYLRGTYIFPNNEPGLSYRGLVYRNGHLNSYNLDNKAIGYWNSDRLEQTLLVGLDLQHHQTKGDKADNYGMGTIDSFNPDNSGLIPFDTSTVTQEKNTKEQFGLYAQHQIKLDARWLLMAGGRFDYVETHNQAISVDEKQYDHNFSFSSGLMYLADNGLSPYVNYAESFEVIAGINANTNRSYEPLKGKQTEVGVKYSPSFFDGYLNLALFDLEQTNVLALTDSSSLVQDQVGKANSQGIEIEAIGYLTDNLKTTASYTYTDATINDPNKRAANIIPRHSATLWADYQFNQGSLMGLTVGSGIRYVGTSEGIGDDKVDAYHLIDAVIGYEINENWRAQLNVNNLLDDEVIASCDGYYCYYGEPRSLIGNLSYRW